MRCSALAQAFKERNVDSFFLIKTDDSQMLADILLDMEIYIQNYELLSHEFNGDDDMELIHDNYRKGYSFLIIDHYNHNESYQQKLKEFGVKWAQFDFDRNHIVIADILINGNVSAHKIDYKEVASSTTMLCVGYEYAIVRKAFVNQKCRPVPNHILIAMGGGRYPQEVLYMIKELISNQEYQFEIVTTDNRILEFAKSVSNVRIYLNVVEVSAVYKACEIAIVAGGVTTFELAALNIPMFVVPYSSNQLPNALAWDNIYYAISFEDVGGFIVSLRQKTLMILIAELQNKFNHRNREIDGYGADRISEIIIKLLGGEYDRD